ncbi:MAG: hypothetical protein R3202_04170 [Candidatus Competibacterales bacterium]|nr:hypothetical protein [Candidatus Competibacterales bacterium]
MSIPLWGWGAVFALVVAAMAVALRRLTRTPPEERRVPEPETTETAHASKIVVLEPGEPCCEAAIRQQDRCFHRIQVRSPPLEDCAMPDRCNCRYTEMSERRQIPDRRSGLNRRRSMRFDPDRPPRRQGGGRRATDNLPPEGR